MRGILSVTMLLAAPLAPPAAAAEWEAVADYSALGRETGEGAWHTAGGAVGARAGNLSGQVRGERVRRYGEWGTRLGLDAYARTWAGAYLNLWMQASPDAEFLPYFDYRVEAYQSLRGRFEVSASFRQMRFEEATVGLAGLGVARYQGAWYIRLSGNIDPLEGTPWSGTVAAKRSFGDGGDFAEARAGAGFSPEVCPDCSEPDAVDGWFLSARGRKSLASGYGAELRAQAGREDDLGPYFEVGGGLFLRW